MQADGRVGEAPFYFRARGSQWTFTECLTPEIDISAIGPKDDKMDFFHEDDCRGFHLSGDYGLDYDESLMPNDEVKRITLDCAGQYLRSAASDVNANITLDHSHR